METSNTTKKMKPIETIADLSECIGILFYEYKLHTIKDNSSIITASLGVGYLGNVQITKVTSFKKEITFEYKHDNYIYISVSGTQKTILWTDYVDEQPFDRQSYTIYVPIPFSYFGNAVVEKPDYREFIYDDTEEKERGIHINGFTHSPYSPHVCFGFCIETDKVEEFMTKLRQIMCK